MANAKLKIDLQAGIVDVEGPVEFVQAIYDEFRGDLKSLNTEGYVARNKAETASPPKQAKNVKKAAISPASSTKRKKKSTPNMLTDLDLSGGPEKPRLKEFLDQYSPTTNYERNLIFGFFLQEVLEEKSLTSDHFYTCYRHIGNVKVPKALQQSLRDTSSHKGWLELDGENVKVSVAGINYMEHDMPQSSQANK